ncbi:hypothetical protein BDQ94DRAFT_139207 [Aspergillus welwitschiae]|uniref:Uncharacterized protein n=1 Tax=Aspergillus welwitschiae TaxID=1341132 RepID=A0A3F3QAE0_9EURO|nr:hypothetical protein BDQ94DRAFT_139207 [Aspergillus welwitschiae]RDH35772.1 hypothetical protein BDQ94DRAFT_139207 [Aspergillus welwitschiae]
MLLVVKLFGSFPPGLYHVFPHPHPMRLLPYYTVPYLFLMLFIFHPSVSHILFLLY